MAIVEKNERNSSIELLHMLFGLAIVILHFNYFPGGGFAFELTVGATQIVLVFLEILCIYAVNVFVLISGYFEL